MAAYNPLQQVQRLHQNQIIIFYGDYNNVFAFSCKHILLCEPFLGFTYIACANTLICKEGILFYECCSNIPALVTGRITTKK